MAVPAPLPVHRAPVHPAPLPAALAGLARTLVMGVVNVTPDSFSDGGRWFEVDDAVAHGLRLVAEGADLLDVGGESTRPGAGRVTVEDELARVLPVVRALTAHGAVVSVDTTRAEVARAAVEQGAVVVNDVSGGLADPAMHRAVAELGVVYVAMHWRGHADVMESRATYDDVVRDVRRELAERMTELADVGVRPEQVVLDPGLGFAKAGSDNWPLLARLDELVSLGRPVLVGASRKRFLGHLLAGPDGVPAPPLRRDGATAAVTALAAQAGAWCVRVHEVAGSADAVRVAAAWRTGQQAGEQAGRHAGPPAEPPSAQPAADQAADQAAGQAAEAAEAAQQVGQPAGRHAAHEGRRSADVTT